VSGLLQSASQRLLRLALRLWPATSRHTLATVLSQGEIRDVLEQRWAAAPDFPFDGVRLPYCSHSYNNFRSTERAIEIPIARHYLERLRPRRVLEIGNVLSYYYSELSHDEAVVGRTVVDKFETAYGVVNRDIRDFSSDTRFDLVLSISTFEHMDSDRGHNPDYRPGRSRRSSQAADNIEHVLQDLLAPGGHFVLTAPIGYSEEWDSTVYSGGLQPAAGVAMRAFAYEKQGDLRWEPASLERGLVAKASPRSAEEMSFIIVVEYHKAPPGQEQAR
jgi:hypothetical protein